MKALLIGGTGVISASVAKRLLQMGWEVTLLNRGARSGAPEGVRVWQADINDTEKVKALLENERFDTVADFIVFTPEQAKRDIELFSGKTGQYIFISSASAYMKPVPGLPITEDTPLVNPYWQYSRDKAAAEALLMQAYREQGFPVTVVRPSHTYCERSLPVQIHGANGPWQICRRMMEGKTVPVAADGETLWTATWAEDFAIYFCGLCGNGAALGEAYHITSDESLTWNGIYRTIAEHLHAEYKPCYVPAHLLAKATQYDFRGALLGDKSNSVIFDNSKVMCATGIPPIHFVSYREGSKRAIDYFLSHPELQKEDPAFDAFCDRVEAAMAAAEKTLLEE